MRMPCPSHRLFGSASGEEGLPKEAIVMLILPSDASGLPPTSTKRNQLVTTTAALMR